jgi:hypothetical protein
MPSKHEDVYLKIVRQLPAANKEENKKAKEQLIGDNLLDIASHTLNIVSARALHPKSPDLRLTLADGSLVGCELTELVHPSRGLRWDERSWIEADVFAELTRLVEKKERRRGERTLNEAFDFDVDWLVIHCDCLAIVPVAFQSAYAALMPANGFDRVFLMGQYVPGRCCRLIDVKSGEVFA